MKIEFLYKDDTYKEVVEKISETLALQENETTYTPVVQAGLNIFSFQKNGENEETAKILDSIKKSILESLSSENLFIITDEVSLYFSQRLYPQVANFERGLRKVLYIASLKSNDENAIKLCKKIEDLEFSGIYQMLFSDDKYVLEAKKIVNSNSPAFSKHDILKQLNNISESNLWDKLFNKQYSYISENFLDIKDGRNKVMHSRNISFVEYSAIKSYLSKSNKLFKEIEFDLLEKENNDNYDLSSGILVALETLGKAVKNAFSNYITSQIITSLGELALQSSNDNQIDSEPMKLSEENNANQEEENNGQA